MISLTKIVDAVISQMRWLINVYDNIYACRKKETDSSVTIQEDSSPQDDE